MTVYLGGVQFLRPIRVGELVELRALVIHTGTKSLHVAIDTYAGDPKGGELHRCGHCVIVFVPVDEGGKPKPVAQWEPVTEVDRALQDYALKLIELRKVMDAEIATRLELLERQTRAISAS